MASRVHRFLLLSTALLGLIPSGLSQQAATGQSSSSSRSSAPSHTPKPVPDGASKLALGSVSDGLYRNPAFGFACKIPAGWVLRTEEMNAREDGEPQQNVGKVGRVLLAAFARPPAARGEDVNSSILIAAESASTYPGMTEAAQYFGPVSEVAKAQGFEVVSEPYEFAAGTKTVVRGDFQKNVGTRVMRQSTLVTLSHGYAVSVTFIGGTEDEVEELVEGLSFAAKGNAAR